MILDHMSNSSLLTIFYPLSIFCFALLENPQPKKKYWQICIYYAIFVLCVKFFFQLKLFNNIFDPVKYSDFLMVLENYKIGIIYYENSFGLDFFRYIVLDALVLIVLSINRNILISNGLWEKREEQIENIYTANERVETTKDIIFRTRKDENNLIKKFILKNKREDINDINNNQILNNINNIIIDNQENQEINTNTNKIAIKNNEDEDFLLVKKKSESKERRLKFNTDKFSPRYNEGDRPFFEKLFPRKRNEKPGDDFYPFYAMTLALIVVYILFFFTKMDQDKIYGPVNLDTTQFSGNMVLFLLLHVIILVYDRAIYISQNKSNLKYKYFLYKKNEDGEGELLSNEERSEIKKEFLKDNKFYIPPSQFENLKSRNYNLFYVQTELFNKPLLHKYILHIFSTVVCHIFVFIYFPMKGNYNLLNTIYCGEGESCNDFSNNVYTIIFYLLYLIYLCLSSIQIRLGYFDIKRKSLFKNNNTFTNTFSKVFNSIPFLPELRNSIDWTFTSTCLDLFKWNQFESIYDTIFDTYCDSEGNDNEEIGEKISKKDKFTMGGTLSFVLVFVLVIPLVLFSSLNPTNKLNNLTGAQLNVYLTFTYENDVVLDYNLFENKRAKTIIDMFKNGDATWEKYNYSESVHTRNFNKDQIQIVDFTETSDRNWDLAEPHIKDLIELLNITEDHNIAKIELNIQTEFTRLLPAEAQTVSKSFSILIFDSSRDSEETEGGKKILKLKSALEDCNNTKVDIIEFEEVYSPPLRITAGEEVSEIEDDKYFFMKDVELGFQGCRKENETIGNETIEVNSYLKSYFTFKSRNKNEPWKGLEFHIFNDKISETTSGYSVLTFYLTFVLVAGSYIKEFLASEPEKIMFTELPHPESIVNLCEGIKIARYSYDFKNEEYLYTILIELMRSPDYLKLLTQSSINHFKIREQNTQNNDEDEQKKIKDEKDKDDEDEKEKDDDDSSSSSDYEDGDGDMKVNNNKKVNEEEEEDDEKDKNNSIENDNKDNDDVLEDKKEDKKEDKEEDHQEDKQEDKEEENK